MSTKQELLAKYNRVAEDKSQLQKFAQDVINGNIGGSFSIKGHTLVLGKVESKPEPEPEPEPERIIFDLRGQVSLTNGDNDALMKDYDFSDLLSLVTWENDMLSVNEPIAEIEILFNYGKNEYDFVFTPDIEVYQERTYWVAESGGPDNSKYLGNNITAEFDFHILAGDTGYPENPTVAYVNLKISDGNIL